MSIVRLKLRMVAKTNVGKIREINEDNFIATNGPSGDSWVLPKDVYENSILGTIMVVADGMGGLNAGEVASKIAIDSAKAFFQDHQSITFYDPAIRRKLEDAILSAHKSILTHSTKHPETEGMGTTAVVARIIENKLHLAWSGDSRCYIFRSGELVQLSKDHSYVQSLVDEGKISPEQAFFHPQSNVITQSLGDADRPPSPDSLSYDLMNDDIILLCSDGLNAMIEDDIIQSILQKNGHDITTCIDKLIDSAIEAGGADNITVILNKVVSGSIENTHKPTLIEEPEVQIVEEDTINGKKKKNRKSLLLFALLLLLAVSGGFLAWKYKNHTVVKRHDIPKGVDTVATPSPPPSRTPQPKANPIVVNSRQSAGGQGKQKDEKNKVERIVGDGLTITVEENEKEKDKKEQDPKNIIELITPPHKEEPKKEGTNDLNENLKKTMKEKDKPKEAPKADKDPKKNQNTQLPII